jgi:hypothetical protein
LTGTWNFAISEGADFSITMTWTAGSPAAPVNLTGWTAHLQIRSTYADYGGTIYADLTNANGGLVLGGSAGTIQVVMPASQTTALGFDRAVYDLKLTNPGGSVTRLIQGTVTFSREVTV